METSVDTNVDEPKVRSFASPHQKRPDGLLSSMWSRMSEYFEMKTISNWSEEGEVSSFPRVRLLQDVRSMDTSNEFFDHRDGSIDSRTNFSSETVNVHHNESFYSTSSTNSSLMCGSSHILFQRSDTLSSDLSSSSLSEDDFVDALQFQEDFFDLDDYDETDQDKTVKFGEGHQFEATRLLHVVTWCDSCGDVIWGFYKQCLRCRNCKYTCHFKCFQNGVRLDCSEYHSTKGEEYDSSPDFTLISTKDVAFTTSLSREELLKRTAEYNAEYGKKVMKVEPDEGTTFFGPVSVHMNLSRPVSIKTGSMVPNFCDSLKRYDHSVATTKRRTSFFLPKSQVESLHISSETTAAEVITCLLERYQLIDNPRKFALFERTEQQGEVLLRKLEDEDNPLLSFLFWGANNETKRMELRENETGVVQWDAFTLPELNNFMKILEKEEEEYVSQVKKKYSRYEKALKDALIEAEKERIKEMESQEEGKLQQESEGAPHQKDIREANDVNGT